jgi:hypothetical protein
VIVSWIDDFVRSRMDPLSALGVAASVLQFVQFGSSLVSKSRQIYTQGTLLDHVECRRATSRLQGLAEQLGAHLNELESLGTLSSDSKALQAICGRCLELSTELLLRLNEIKVDENQRSRKWKSFRQALKSVCSKDKVDGIAGKLIACREELNLHLITCIKQVSISEPIGIRLVVLWIADDKFINQVQGRRFGSCAGRDCRCSEQTLRRCKTKHPNANRKP